VSDARRRIVDPVSCAGGAIEGNAEDDTWWVREGRGS